MAHQGSRLTRLRRNNQTLPESTNGHGASAGMSAPPLKQTYLCGAANVGSVPQTVLSSRNKMRERDALLDHLIGTGEQRGRHRDADCLRGLQVDDQLGFSDLLDR